MLEPNDLLLFARVVEEGSFSRAAERLTGFAESEMRGQPADGIVVSVDFPRSTEVTGMEIDEPGADADDATESDDVRVLSRAEVVIFLREPPPPAAKNTVGSRHPRGPVAPSAPDAPWLPAPEATAPTS